MLKQHVFHLIEGNPNNESKAHSVFGTLMFAVIVLSVVQIILESFNELYNNYSYYFILLEYITIVIFTVEFLLRIWTADLLYPEDSKSNARIKYFCSFSGLVDFLSIIPFFLPLIFKFDFRFLKVLRLVRLLRVFKLNRYSNSYQIIVSVLKETKRNLIITIFVAFIVVLLSSIIMFHLESELQPKKFPNIIETFWWSIATLTTIGYGDVIPITGLGKFMSGLLALLGIGIVALPTGVLSAAFYDKINSKSEKDGECNSNFCPNCGVSLRHGDKSMEHRNEKAEIV